MQSVITATPHDNDKAVGVRNQHMRHTQHSGTNCSTSDETYLLADVALGVNDCQREREMKCARCWQANLYFCRASNKPQ